MILSFRHKGLERYWTKGNPSGVNPKWLARVSRILRVLDIAAEPEDSDLPGYFFHRLSGADAGRYSVRVTGNYRMTFAWLGEDAIDVDLEDYH